MKVKEVLRELREISDLLRELITATKAVQKAVSNLELSYTMSEGIQNILSYEVKNGSR